MNEFEITIYDANLCRLLTQTVFSDDYSEVVTHAKKLIEFFSFNSTYNIKEIE